MALERLLRTGARYFVSACWRSLLRSIVLARMCCGPAKRVVSSPNLVVCSNRNGSSSELRLQPGELRIASQLLGTARLLRTDARLLGASHILRTSHVVLGTCFLRTDGYVNVIPNNDIRFCLWMCRWLWDDDIVPHLL